MGAMIAGYAKVLTFVEMEIRSTELSPSELGDLKRLHAGLIEHREWFQSKGVTLAVDDTRFHLHADGNEVAMIPRRVRRSEVTASVSAGSLTLGAEALSVGSSSKAKASARVRPAPGSRLLEVAELLFSRAACENVLIPTVQDMRDEYNAALAAGQRHKATLVRIRGTWAFLQAAGLLKALSIVKSAVRMWSAV